MKYARIASALTGLVLVASGLLVLPGTASAKGATGSVLKIGMQLPITNAPGAAYDISPEELAGAQAAVNAINKAGGVQGHRLEIVSCNTENSAADEINCARTETSSGVFAMADTFSILSSSTVAAVFIKAGLAMVGGGPLTPTTGATSAQIRNLSITYSGEPGAGTPANPTYEMRAVAAFAKAYHLNGVYPLIDNIPAAFSILQPAGPPTEKSELASLGVKYDGFTAIPPAASDYTSYVNEAEQTGAQILQIVSGGEAQDQIISGAYQTGFKGDEFMLAALTSQEVKTLGPAANNHVFEVDALPIATDTAVPGIKLFNQQVAAARSAGVANLGPTDIDVNSLGGWLNTQFIAKIADSIHGPITAQSFLQAVHHAKNVNVEGLIDYTFGKSDSLYYVYGVKNGVNDLAKTSPLCIAAAGCGSVKFGKFAP